MRENLLSAAVALFLQRGYEDVSLEDVAHACDLSDVGVRHHFPTKEDLLVAVLARRDEGNSRDHPLSGRPGRVILSELVDIARFNMGEPQMVALYARLSSEATVAEHSAFGFFQARYAAVVEMIAQVYATLAEEGELRDGVVPEVAAQQLVALMDGMQIQWLYDDSIDMPRAVESLINCHLRAPL